MVTQGLTVSGKKFRFYSKCNGKPLKGFQQERNWIRLKFLKNHCQGSVVNGLDIDTNDRGGAQEGKSWVDFNIQMKGDGGWTQGYG